MKLQTLPNIEEVIRSIASPPEAYLVQAKTHLDALTKPLGSLGRLEELAAQWFAIRRGNFTAPVSRAVYVFAADHGITAEGVSHYPSEVTAQMVLNFLSGGAAINVLARLNQAEVNVVDVGVDADLAEHAGLMQCKVRRGSRNMLQEAAMNEEEVAAALAAGLSRGGGRLLQRKQPGGGGRNGNWQQHRSQRHDRSAYRHACQPS